ncbi:MAG: hypothetical protein JJU29_19890 [Verrucomicrobia bacterium]|nr:hypothetical protein [Verrucomicrobiota bacterium]
MIKKIVSGGQTGADRGGLDAAIYCGIPHGGCCQKGRGGRQTDLRPLPTDGEPAKAYEIRH